MRAFVFTDPALASSAGQFVWLAVNTEKPENAGFPEKFSLQAWPTYYVVDPANEQVILRWVGAMTVAQVQTLLEDAQRARASQASSLTAEDALALADRLYGEGKNAEAAQAYREAIAAAPADWPQYRRAVESLLFSYITTGEAKAGAALARDAMPRLAGTPSAVTVSAGGLDCALEIPAEDGDRPKVVAALEAAVHEALADPRANASADDRSSAYISLLEARKDAHDDAGAHEVAKEWAAFLEEQAAAAPTAEQRTVFDSHRLSAYLELGEPERAVEMLKASERAFPDDYNPPARLALAYAAMEEWSDALAASDRALKRAYGPRKVRLLLNRADIFEKKGDPASARQTLEEAAAFLRSLPEGQRSQRLQSEIERRLGDTGSKR